MKQVIFLRHAQSFGNVGQNILNPSLTQKGIEQSSKLYGYYDVVILSELKRTRETLENSNIKYEHLIVSPLVNEVKLGNITECVSLNDCKKETDEDVVERIKLFSKLLNDIWDHYNSILVISHAEFIKRFTKSYNYLNNAESVAFEVI
jgi:broad specificity phosphatase PhoE